jgi:hypothetical protein
VFGGRDRSCIDKQDQPYLLPALTFAHRFLAAALMLASPCAEMRRPALIGTTFFCFAQRARCAAAIRLRAAADILPLRA